MLFNNASEIEQYVLSKFKASIIKIQQQIFDIMDKLIDNYYYREYDPTQYQRTKQFLHSLVKADIIPTSHGYEAEVYVALGSYSPKGITNEEIRYYNMLGTHGGVMQGVNIWQETKNILNRELYNIIRQELINNGIPIK